MNSPPSGAGTVVIGTAEGDIHDIGKTLVAALLSANGFMVHERNVMLAEVLRDAGFVTAGFAGSFALESRFDHPVRIVSRPSIV